MNRRRREVSGDEARLWFDAMRDVIPLPGRPPVEPPPAPTAVGPVPPAAVVPPPPPSVATHKAAPLSAPALRHGRVVDLDKRTAERLKSGAMPIEAVIDLHGMTQDAAHGALNRFISGAAERRQRCLLVITGKGTREGAGVLRQEVPRWLNEAALRPLVLAFAYARPQHGGEGALYILLKRRR